MLETVFTILILAQVASCQSELPEEEKSRSCTKWCSYNWGTPPTDDLVQTLVEMDSTDLTNFCDAYKKFKQCLDECAEGVAKTQEILRNVPRRYICLERYDGFTKWISCSHRHEILSNGKCDQCEKLMYTAHINGSNDAEKACQNADCYSDCTEPVLNVCFGSTSTRSLLKETLREVTMSNVNNYFEAKTIPKELFPESCKKLASKAGAVKAGPRLLGASVGVFILRRVMVGH